MKTINEVVVTLLDKGSRVKDLASTLGVSEALVSTWKNKDNDFVPRLPIAKKIYREFGYIVYPYAEEALIGK